MNRHLRNEKLPAPLVAKTNTGVFIVNSLLLVAALMLLAYYVVQANTLAAMDYDVAASGDEIVKLREVYHSVGADIADLEHPDTIAAYARSVGMVLASDAHYVSVPDAPLAGR